MASDGFTPQPARRVVEPSPSRRKLTLDPVCRACGRRARNTHHLLGRGQGGPDEAWNLIPVCGSGSHGCHGALHGNPYTDTSGRRWTARDVRERIGLTLRLPEASGLVEALGEAPALEHLRRLYYVTVTLTPFRKEPA